MSNVVPFSNENKILTVRGQRVMLDKDVAGALEIDTKRLNENASRSSKWKYLRDSCVEEAYRFRLTHDDIATLRSQYATFNEFNHLPWVYTQVGCAYFGTSLDSTKACKLAVELSTAFVAIQNAQSSVESTGNVALDRLKVMVAALEENEKERQKLARMATETSKKLVETASRVDRLESSFDDISHKVKNREDEHFAVAGYASLKGISPYPNPRAQADGLLATKLSNARGVGYYKVKDPRFGRVNVYHESILKEVFGE